MGLGIIIKASEELKIGIQIRDMSRTNSFTKPALRIGASYKSAYKTISYFEIEKEFTSTVNIKSGLSYEPNKSIRIDIGLSSNPILLSMGLGILIDHIRTDLSFTRHQTLGSSPGVSLLYEL